jgi:hypothetical protein
MGEVGTDGGRHDDGDRGAEAKLHTHVFRHAEHAKALVEHRHDHRAPADAEQTGENTGNHAADEEREHQPEDFVQTDAEKHSRVYSVIPGPSQRVRPEVAGPMTGSARSPESITANVAARCTRVTAKNGGYGFRVRRFRGAPE